jgi:hypothetical protein
VIRYINLILRGFVNYYKCANCKKVRGILMGWLRWRLRAIQMKLWKKSAKLYRRLRPLGYKGKFLKIKMGSWRNAACQQSSMAMPNRGFVEQGLYPFREIEIGKFLPCTIRDKVNTGAVYEVRTHGSVRGAKLSLITPLCPTRFGASMRGMLLIVLV